MAQSKTHRNWRDLSSKAARPLAAIWLLAAVLGAARLELRNPPPTTRPVAVVSRMQVQPIPAKSITLPPPFATLMSRSIFAKNGMASSPPGTNPGPPEAMMALRGIAFDDSSFLAFIEDTASHRTMQLRCGEAVASGKIADLSLDEMGFESSGKVTHVRIGQNLLGAMLPAVALPKPAAAPPGMPPGAAPPPGKGPPPGPIFEIGPDGQRIRNLVKERAAAG